MDKAAHKFSEREYIMNTRTPWLFEAPIAHELDGGPPNPPQQTVIRLGQPIDASKGPDLLNTAQVARAVQQNKRFEHTIWRGYYDPISIYYLRYRFMTPVESEFAQAVARWQSAVGLHVDGVIGPRTWRVMRPRGEPQRFTTPDGLIRPSSRAQVLTTFGDPRPDPGAWERANIVRANAPRGFLFQQYLGSNSPTVLVNTLILPQFERLFQAIAAEGLWDAIQPVSGPYVHRNIAGSTSLSMHAFGLAIDINPDVFAQGQNRAFPDPFVVEIFQDHGFHWGIFFPNPDPMHFQFATGT